MLSTSTRRIQKPDEQSVERERAITLILKAMSNAPAALTPSFVRQSYSYSVQRYSYSYSKGALMAEPTFDHERLDVYRLSIAQRRVSRRHRQDARRSQTTGT
jgi:hypothetical protein